LLNPILKLFVNPQPLVHFVWKQAQAQADINEKIEHWMRNREQSDIKLDPLYYEILHNLVLELTRTGIEVHNLKMRVESLSSRVDFDERRSRSLERVVEYRPVQQQRPAQAHAAGPNADRQGPPSADARPQGRPEGDNERRRRRRRRRRRPGQTMADQSGMTQAPSGSPGPEPPSMSSAPAEDDSGGHDDGASDQ
jgi:hypothetical protein